MNFNARTAMGKRTKHRAPRNECLQVHFNRHTVLDHSRRQATLPARLLCGLAFLFSILLNSVAVADAVKNIRSQIDRPIAIRGGILMLPLIADKPGNRWPATLELTLSDRSTIAAQVIWIEPAPPPMARQWTDDPRGLAVRAVREEDHSAMIDVFAGMGPYLLANLPPQGTGDFALGRQKLKAQWHDPPTPAALEAERPTLDLATSPDRPDADSPFEYWRWTLLADRLEMRPPPPAGLELEQQVARHYADLWQLGMSRLRTQSARIAEECREVLTRTGIDRRQTFAAWLSVPQATNALLSRLMDFSRSDTTVLSDAVSWLDAQEPLYLWPVSEAGAQVRVAALAARSEPVEAQFNWRGSRDEPVAMRIETGVLTQIEVDRLPLPKRRIGLPAAPEPAPQVLNVEVKGRGYQLPFGTRSTVCKPPGVFFRPLAPPLTLGEVQMHLQRTMAEDHQTLAQVRRLSGRWEVFIESRRPQSELNTPAIESESLRGVTSLDDLRGMETVTLLLGPDDSHGGPTVWLIVPENGWHQLVKGENDGTLQVHRQSLADRWYCRIVLPTNWLPLPGPGGEPLLISVARSHADLRQIESGPGATVPWRLSPARAAIDLSQWDDLPTTP